MPLTYNTVIRSVALAINALTGATAATLETSFSTVPLTSSNFQSSIIPFTAIKDRVLDSESQIVTAAANNANHPYRGALLTQTSALAYGAQIPTTVSSDKIIGVRGAVRNQDSEVMTKANLSQIRARVQNPNTMFVVDVDWYAIDDQRLYHTATTATIDVVAYSRPVADSLVLTTNVLLPDDAAPAYVNGALMACIRDDEFMAQGGRFGASFNEWVARVTALGSVDSATAIAA